MKIFKTYKTNEMEMWSVYLSDKCIYMSGNCLGYYFQDKDIKKHNTALFKDLDNKIFLRNANGPPNRKIKNDCIEMSFKNVWAYE